MTDNVAVSLLTLPIELIYRIMDDIDILAIEISVRNVCTRLKVIAHKYRQYQTLTTLVLQSNEIGHRGTKHFANMLQNNTTLMTSGLGDNQGAAYLADGLENNTTLITLSLGANSITDQGKNPQEREIQKQRIRFQLT